MNTVIEKYFPHLTDLQKEKINQMKPLYEEWNEKINVISRKDMDGFYEKHVLHSLGIAKIISFAPATKILDIGTGGGFPGIPLAILFPDSEFTLVDSIGKKIKVVQEMAGNLNLKNVKAVQMRAENIEGKFDFVVSRAVTQMPIFMTWMKGKFLRDNNNSLKNGVLYLKGGDLSEELKDFKQAKIYPLKDFFEEDFFETKKLVYLPNSNRN